MVSREIRGLCRIGSVKSKRSKQYSELEKHRKHKKTETEGTQCVAVLRLVLSLLDDLNN